MACVCRQKARVAFLQRRRDLMSTERDRIEGIGRPRVAPSFVPSVIDQMLRMPEALSFAAALDLSQRLGRRVGPSIGCKLPACCTWPGRWPRGVRGGSIATLICDAGERYDGTLFAPGWVAALRFGAAAAVQDSDDRPAP